MPATTSVPGAGNRSVAEASGPQLWRVAAGSGVASALLGAALAVGVALICWLPDAAASGRPGSVLRAGVFAFLAAHRPGVVLDGVQVDFVPLGLLMLVVALCWRAGAVTGAAAQLTASPIGAGGSAEVGGAEPARLAGALAVQVASYVAVCSALSQYAHFGSTHISVVSTVVATTLVSAGASASSAIRYVARPTSVWPASGPSMRAGLRAGTAAALVYIVAGTALGLGSLIVHAGKVMEISREVGGGLSGAPVAILGALSVPNASVAGLSYLAGPGFSVGSGASFSAFDNTRTVVPAFPLLAALPTGHAGNVVVLALMISTILTAGAITARMILRAGFRLRPSLATSAIASAGAGGLVAGLVGLGGGAVGQARLRTVGGSPALVGGAVAVQVCAVSIVLVCVVSLYRWATGRGQEEADAEGIDSTDESDTDSADAMPGMPGDESDTETDTDTDTDTEQEIAPAAAERRVS